MADGDEYNPGSLIRYLDSEQARNMDPVSFVCTLGLINVYTIVNLMQSLASRQGAMPAEGLRKAPDPQVLAQTISGLMSGQGGQKLNTGAFMGLLNMLSSHMDRPPSRPESKPEDAPPPARLEPRSEQRRAAGDSGDRDARSAVQK
ncbi:MAG: hypothetical protein ACM3X4_13010 [Ignavibacteriales bacterium]